MEKVLVMITNDIKSQNPKPYNSLILGQHLKKMMMMMMMADEQGGAK
jgi:hypothetical protein